MADGQILIDSRIQTDKAQQDTQDLKKTLESLADAASASAKNIEKSFDSLSIDDAAEGLGESFQKEAQEVEAIPEQIQNEFDEIDLEDTAKGLGESFEEEARKVDDIPEKIERDFEDMDLEDVTDNFGEDFRKETEEIEEGFEEAAVAADKLDDALDDIEAPKGLDGFMEGFIGGIASGLTQSAIEILGRLGEKLVELGKQAVQAAADVQASEAQFSQAFQGIEDSARSTLEGIAEETGIISTRMQDSYTKIYSFLKTLGTDTTTALDISARAMTVAADQAAYYDKSIEEVTKSLQSFLKGNYENDAALGIAATETTRNAKANEMYAKSFQKLSESQKVDVLLAMVEAGNEASGALGQAAREVDSWANVTGNLSEAWRKFIAALGSPVLETITPIIQEITRSLQEMTDKMSNPNTQEAFFAMFSTALQNIANEMGIVTFSAIDLADQTEQLAEKETEMAIAAQETVSALKRMQEEYNDVKTAARSSLDSQIGLFTKLATQSEMTASQMVKNWEQQKSALENYGTNLQKLVDAGLADELVKQLSDGSQESMLAVQELAKSTEVSIDEINAAFRGVEEAKDVVSSTMASIQSDMAGRILEMRQNLIREFGSMENAVDGSISQMQASINSLKGKDVYINVITTTSGSTSASLAGGIRDQLTGGPTPYAVSEASVPFLASGAVIPPGAPFFAVLGDQRNGTNLEAPESLIRKIVREESGNTANVESLLKTLISTVQSIEVGDTVIGEAASRYSAKQRIIHGGT